MIALLVSLVFAQSPQEFEPFPADVTIGDDVFMGILVDESDFTTFTRLTVESVSCQEEVGILERAVLSDREISDTTIASLRDLHERDMEGMQAYYMKRVEALSDRTFLEKNGVAVGIGIGVVGTIAAVVATASLVNATNAP